MEWFAPRRVVVVVGLSIVIVGCGTFLDTTTDDAVESVDAGATSTGEDGSTPSNPEGGIAIDAEDASSADDADADADAAQVPPVCTTNKDQLCAGKCGSVPDPCQIGIKVACTTCQGCTPDAATVTCSGGKCGTITNNCGVPVSCSCTGLQTCGGGGTPDICGCTPSSVDVTCGNGTKCGSITNNCGAPVTCSCALPKTCGGGNSPGICGCTPEPDSVTCNGKCGVVITNNCGVPVTCSCAAPQTCGGGGTPGMCGTCVPLTVCPNHQCKGSILDGCGGMLDCTEASCTRLTDCPCGGDTKCPATGVTCVCTFSGPPCQ